MRPSAWWYVVVVPIFVIGLVAAIGFGVKDVYDAATDLERLGSDGRGSVTLDEGDTATVWALWKSTRSTDAIDRPAALVTVTGPDGRAVPYRSAGSGSRSTFSVGSLSGIDVGTFTPTRSGEHEISVSYPPGAVAPDDTAVGSIDILGAVADAFRSIGLVILACIAWVVFITVLRRRSRRRAEQQPQGPVPPTPPSSVGPFR